MPEWSAQEEALYQELEQRARDQAQALYARRRREPHRDSPPREPAPPPGSRPPPPPKNPQKPQEPTSPPEGRHPPRYTIGRRPQQNPGADSEWILLALLLYILIRENADQELILALVYVLLF